MIERVKFVIVFFVALLLGIGGTLVLTSSEKKVILSHKQSLLVERKTVSRLPSSKNISNNKLSDPPVLSKQEVTAPDPFEDVKTFAGLDYFKMLSQERFFNLQVNQEVAKKGFSERQSRNIKQDARAIKLVNKSMRQGHSWYKGTLSNEATKGIPTVIFLRYLNMLDEDLNEQQEEVSDIRIELKLMAKMNNSYSENNDTYILNSLLLRDGRVVVPFYLFGISDFEKEIKIVKLFLPLPGEKGEVEMLKYENEKLNWEEPYEIRWVESSRKEFESVKYLFVWEKNQERFDQRFREISFDAIK